MSFNSSTQRRCWLLDIDDIYILRHISNRNSIDAKEKLIRTLPATIPIVTDITEEEIKIVKIEEIYLTRLSKLLQTYFGEETDDERARVNRRVAGFPLYWRVSATAITYYRRFYLNNSLKEFDPKILMLAAVFLAGKTEECRVKMGHLLSVHTSCTAEQIYAHELILIQGLDYNLNVYHPRNVLHTLIADYKRWSETRASTLHMATRSLSEIAETKEGGDAERDPLDGALSGPADDRMRADSSESSLAKHSFSEVLTVEVRPRSKKIKLEFDINDIVIDSTSEQIGESLRQQMRAESLSLSDNGKENGNIEAQLVVGSSSSGRNSARNSFRESGSKDGSAMRKTWRVIGERLLMQLQCTCAGLCFTPTEIAVSALIIGLRNMIEYDQEAVAAQFNHYLLDRFGAEATLAFQSIVDHIERFLALVLQAERDDDLFKRVEETVKVSNVW